VCECAEVEVDRRVGGWTGQAELGDPHFRLLFSGLVEAALVLVGEFAGAGSEREDQDEEQQ
jgi:hypothetical protein